ncbi:hypothetical protein THIX_10420 [Thiomonas sp. X19]|nr:hypothetical protein THIX_10420 [Thiomonas sp. X19]
MQGAVPNFLDPHGGGSAADPGGAQNLSGYVAWAGAHHAFAAASWEFRHSRVYAVVAIEASTALAFDVNHG